MQIRHYNEIRPRGTSEFPMELYHISKAHPRYIMDLHWHVELELIRILSGTLKLTLDGREYIASAGDAFWIGAGVLHAAEPENCVYECLVFDPSLLLRTGCDGFSFVPEEKARILLPHPRLPIPDTPTAEALQLLFETMEASQEQGRQLLVQGTLLILMGRILALGCYEMTPETLTPTARNIVRIKEVLSFLEAHHTEALTLPQLSRLAGMSPKYFCRFFKEMTGRTPIDFLNYYRIERASFLLIASDASVTDIAYACGFNDLSYFIRTFRRYMGVSPTTYVHSPRNNGR